jgi:hypothetical protein
MVWFTIHKKANLNSIDNVYIGVYIAVFFLRPLLSERADRRSPLKSGWPITPEFTSPARCPQNSTTHRYLCPTMSIQTTQNIKFHIRRPQTRPQMLNACLGESLLPTISYVVPQPPAKASYLLYDARSFDSFSKHAQNVQVMLPFISC